MTRIRIVGLLIIAVFALTAFASAEALAAGNPVLVKAGTKAGYNGTVTGKAGTSFLQPTATGAAKVECASEESASTLTSTTVGEGMTSGTSTVTFKKCKTAAGKCANKGTEEITGTVSVLLVWVGTAEEKKPGTLISILPVSTKPGEGKGQLLSFKCSGELVDVESTFIASGSRGLNESFTEANLIAEQSGGVQKDKKYTENGKSGENHFWSDQGGKAFGESAEMITNEETYPASVELIEG